MGQKAANTKLATTTKPLHGIQGEEHKKGKKQRQYSTPSSIVLSKALHGRLAGRFKPPLAGRCNDFAPSRQKNCHRQKQPSRPGPRKKKKTPPRPVPSKKNKKVTPSRLGKKNNRPVPPRKKKKRPVPPRKKKNPPRPAMNSKIHRPEGGNWKQIPPPVSFSLFLVAHLYRIVV